MSKNKKLIILYQPPQRQLPPRGYYIHPAVYMFLGLVVFVAMASVVAAVVK